VGKFSILQEDHVGDADDQIRPGEFHRANGLADWRVVSDGAVIHFRTTSLDEGARLVARISQIPDVEQHPPAIDLRRGGVTVRLITMTEQFAGLTQRDAAIARQISEVGRELGLSADPAAVHSLLIVPGAPDVKAVMPFWRAALGYQPRIDSPEEDLVDPFDRTTPLWFEAMDEPRADGGGAVHVAVWLPPEQTEARVKAALDAGGHMVRDEFAPSWWTLADAAGNEVDIASVRGRDWE
jgi:4a-hydroxytetrahydrobiopterin dehydratase